MSADEPRVQISFSLSEFQELAEWLDAERPPIVQQLLETWASIRASVEEGVSG